MSDYPMLISNKLHSFRNFLQQIYELRFKLVYLAIWDFRLPYKSYL